MKKSYVQGIIAHDGSNMDLKALSDSICKFHYDIIERRLSQSELLPEEKSEVIKKIIEILKSQETSGAAL